MKEEKLMRPQTLQKNYRQPRNAESKKNSLFQGKAPYLVIQCQMVSSEITYVIIYAEQLIFRNIYNND